MSVRIGIFGAEDGTSSENFVKISSNRHLFVQLRRLSKVRVTEHELESSRKIGKVRFEVVHFENIGTTFGSGRDDFWRVKLDKTLVGKVLTEKSANASLNSENGLFRSCTQIKNSVIQSGVGIYTNEPVIFGIIRSLWT